MHRNSINRRGGPPSAPSWQRDVLPRMRKVFKGCQFIVTTHSPFVLTNVDVTNGDKLMLVNEGEIEIVENNIYGREVSLILGEILQTPSTPFLESPSRKSCLKNGSSLFKNRF